MKCNQYVFLILNQNLRVEPNYEYHLIKTNVYTSLIIQISTNMNEQRVYIGLGFSLDSCKYASFTAITIGSTCVTKTQQNKVLPN